MTIYIVTANAVAEKHQLVVVPSDGGVCELRCGV